jgi:cation diffusion facilitator family transporter
MASVCAHGHDEHEFGERGTRGVFWLTCATMIVEIVSGWAFGSMALLADGWHMASHAGAMGVAWFAYYYIRKNRDNREFVFGAGKANSLAGFASSVGLLLVSLYMAVESFVRFFLPVPIAFTEAILVTCFGLVVNVISALWLHDSKGHSHHHDHNLKAAYTHVLADALTSVLAIVALLGGALYGWNRLDSVMGMVGALVVGRWAVGLMKQTSRVLLDRRIPCSGGIRPDEEVARERLGQVKDLALWSVGVNELAARLLVEDDGITCSPAYCESLRSRLPNLKHVVVEVRKSPEKAAKGRVVHA